MSNMDAHEPWRQQSSDIDEPVVPEADGPRVRYLHIVARARLDLLLTLRRQFQDDSSVHVMLDRREGDRRRQSRPVVFADRRQSTDRRRPREYGEDIAYHPAVIIPLGTVRHPQQAAAPPVGATAAQERPDPTDPGLTRERLLAWMGETRHLVQRVVPAIVQERDAARARLEQATRRCRDLQAESDALRVEVARLTGFNRQLEREHADVARRLGRFLTEVGGALEPLRELQHRHASPASTRPSGPSGAGGVAGRVLIADTEPVAAAVLRDELGRLGHTVKMAVGGREALGLVHAFEPDIVLLDVTVQDPPASEVLDQIHRLDPDLPVVVMMTAVPERDAPGLLARGAFDHLAKPLSLDRAERVVAAAVARRRA
jgi:CheY-like chemotaxis protein